MLRKKRLQEHVQQVDYSILERDDTICTCITLIVPVCVDFISCKSFVNVIEHKNYVHTCGALKNLTKQQYRIQVPLGLEIRNVLDISKSCARRVVDSCKHQGFDFSHIHVCLKIVTFFGKGCSEYARCSESYSRFRISKKIRSCFWSVRSA